MTTVSTSTSRANNSGIKLLVALTMFLVTFALAASLRGFPPPSPLDPGPILAVGDGGAPPPPPDDPDSRPSPTLPLPPPAGVVASR